MLETQKFIAANGVAALTAELGIKVREYPETGYIILNYDQIESPKSHPVVMECRSLILDRNNEVVSRAFDRFFNYGEAPDYYADFDISRSKVFEKADGSLVKVYWSPATGQWEISTRSTAFAELDHALGGVFKDWVLRAFNCEMQQLQVAFADTPHDHSCIFEYIGPDNRIVTPYETSQMVLLAIRNHRTGDYVDAIEDLATSLVSQSLNVRPAVQANLNTAEAVIKAAADLPTLSEGYVCWDPVSNKRVKIKNPAYVAVHHLRENGALSLKNVYLLTVMNEHEEYLSYFEADRPFFEPAIARVAALRDSLVQVWDQTQHIEDQKTFALAVKDHSFKSVLFKAKKDKVSALEAFDALSDNYKLGLFGL